MYTILPRIPTVSFYLLQYNLFTSRYVLLYLRINNGTGTLDKY